MTSGKSGFIELSPSVLWASVRVCYEETFDTATNTSNLKITSVQVKSTGYRNVDYFIDGVIRVDGKQVLALDSAAGTAYVSVLTGDNWYSIRNAADNTDVTAELTGIVHDNTGARTVEIGLAGNRFQRFAFYTADGENGNGWGVKDARTIELTDIPRASPIAATDANIGSVSTVTVTRRNAQYSHSVGFSFGALSGWLDADGSIVAEEKKLTAAVIPFRIPVDFYTQLADAPWETCLLTCTTYLENDPIGDAQQTAFRITADADICAPAVSGTVTDVNPVTAALTGDPGKLIRYASHALCAISAQAQQGATIVSKTIAGVAAEDSRILEKTETGTVVFTATDSRGYTGTAVVTAEMIPYVPLTLHAQAKRTDPTSGDVLLQVKGNYYCGAFGAAGNTLTVSYAVGNQSGTVEIAAQEDSYLGQILLSGLDYRIAHTITVTAEDKISTLSASAAVGKGVPVFDWGEEDFAFHVPVELEGGFTIGGRPLLELVYPIGCVYVSMFETDPGYLVGGTWQTLENTLGFHMWKRTA